MTDNAAPSWLARPRVRRWLKGVGIGVAALFLTYVIGGFVGVPLVLKHLVIAKVDKQIVGSLEIGSVRFNPFTWVLEIKGFKGRTNEGEVAASFEKFRLNLQPTTVFADEMVVREILFDQPKGIVRINPAGELNLLSLFGMEEPKTEDPDAEPTLIPSLIIETLEVRDASMELAIESFEEPFERKLKDISFVMKNVRSHATHDNPYELALLSDEGEKITIGGLLRLDPLSSTGTVRLDQLQLADFTSFSDSLLDARIGKGTLDLSFDYRFQPLREQPEFGIFDGHLEVRELELHEDDAEQAIQRIGSMHAQDFYLDITRRMAGLQSIEIDGALLSLARDSGGLHLSGQANAKTNTSPVKAGPDKEETGDQDIVIGVVNADHDIGEALTEANKHLQSLSGGKAGKPLQIEVGAITVNNTSLRMMDQSVSPVAFIQLSGIALDAGPYHSDGSEALELDLSASMQGKGSITVDGSISAHDYQEATTLNVELKEIAMAAFGAYATPAIGRAPREGALTAKLNYTVRKGIMEGSNVLTIQDLELGPQSKAEDAPKLPLDLAIAILKDTHGTIEIDLPVKGDFNHPEFDYGRIVSHAIANVITKVATAPFRMLGNLLPEGENFDEDFIAFEEGSSEWSDKSRKMVEAIAKVMKARPLIGVELCGGYTTDQDSKALAELSFEKQVAELTNKGKSRKDAIKSLYKDLPKDQKEKGWLLPKPLVMEADVRKAIKISKEDLKSLADQRVKAVLEALKKASIEEERIEIKSSKTADSPRVELSFDIGQ